MAVGRPPPDAVTGAFQTRKHLIIGLGNPGRAYERTRHNAGFDVLAVLATRHGGTFRRPWRGPRGESLRVDLPGHALTLLRPLTFMNLSGEAVRPLLRRGGGGDGFALDEILLVYDDMDLPSGSLRVRAGGSGGGHRGVASVLAATGSTAVARVRVGIGRPVDGLDAAEYVLRRLPAAEQPAWRAAVERAADAVEVACVEGLEEAMDRFNRTPG